MTKVFVHGNPETDAIWQPLIAALSDRGVDDDLVCLSPPGFGAALPDGFGATAHEYRDWLIAQIETMGGPVDIVGHDWGAGHVYNLLDTRPDLVRTWTADCVGLLAEGYVWHDAAQLWQTPGTGEEVVAMMTGGSVEDKTSAYVDLGIPEATAAQMAASTDATMGQCILDLYRSAVQPALEELGQRLRAVDDLPPGLVVVAPLDHYCGDVPTMHEQAEALGAGTVVLPDLGHWWMFDGIDIAADAMVAHWA